MPKRMSIAVGVDVEDGLVPGEALDFDLELLRVTMPVPACGHLVANGNRALFQAGARSTRRRGEDQVPHLLIDSYLGRRMWPGKTDRRHECARDIELIVLVFAPSVVGAHGCRDRNGYQDYPASIAIQRECLAISDLPARSYAEAGVDSPSAIQLMQRRQEHGDDAQEQHRQ